MGTANDPEMIQSLIETLRLVLSRLDRLPDGCVEGLHREVERLRELQQWESEMREKLGQELRAQIEGLRSRISVEASERLSMHEEGSKYWMNGIMQRVEMLEQQKSEERFVGLKLRIAYIGAAAALAASIIQGILNWIYNK